CLSTNNGRPKRGWMGIRRVLHQPADRWHQRSEWLSYSIPITAFPLKRISSGIIMTGTLCVRLPQKMQITYRKGMKPWNCILSGNPDFTEVSHLMGPFGTDREGSPKQTIGTSRQSLGSTPEGKLQM